MLTVSLCRGITNVEVDDFRFVTPNLFTFIAKIKFRPAGVSVCVCSKCFRLITFSDKNASHVRSFAKHRTLFVGTICVSSTIQWRKFVWQLFTYFGWTAEFAETVNVISGNTYWKTRMEEHRRKISDRIKRTLRETFMWRLDCLRLTWKFIRNVKRLWLEIIVCYTVTPLFAHFHWLPFRMCKKWISLSSQLIGSLEINDKWTP